MRLPNRLAVWGHLLVVALLMCVVPFLLFAWAEQHISSGLASIFNATTPLMTTIATVVILRSERPTLGRTLGVLLGFAGILVLAVPSAGFGDADVPAQLACLASTACYGMAFTDLRRFVAPLGLPALSTACVQVGLAAAVLVVFTPFAGGPVHRVDPGAVISVLALGAVGTGLAYVWNTNIVAAWGATNASTVTYLTPVVGVTLGAVILGEKLSWTEPVGTALILIGIVIAQGRLRIPRKQPTPTATQSD
ncbi:DMT family transporter [Planctomonas sp. JC2975]|uniref:DMT family transporter n=1 Tax=Planctomonas sp. JC2975 TaxID=2729626 RepID=UPI00197C5865|nr:DMT family transporter [Planctomonas sp. JC2975]